MDYDYETRKGLTERLGISGCTLWRWMNMGLPYVKIRRKLVFDMKRVDEWLEKHMTVKGVG